MPASAIAEALLQPVLEVVAQLVGYYTSWVIAPFFTFGTVVVEPLISGRKVYPKWRLPLATGKAPKVLDAEMASLFGFVFWFLVGTAAYLVWSKT